MRKFTYESYFVKGSPVRCRICGDSISYLGAVTFSWDHMIDHGVVSIPLSDPPLVLEKARVPFRDLTDE